jgi:hypothetical protein
LDKDMSSLFGFRDSLGFLKYSIKIYDKIRVDYNSITIHFTLELRPLHSLFFPFHLLLHSFENKCKNVTLNKFKSHLSHELNLAYHHRGDIFKPKETFYKYTRSSLLEITKPSSCFIWMSSSSAHSITLISTIM